MSVFILSCHIIYSCIIGIFIESNTILLHKQNPPILNSICDPNVEEDELEQAAKLKDPKKSKQAAILFNGNISSQKFGHLCVEASMIILLLKLKNFLRKSYGITETRISEYLPSEKDKLFEKGVSKLDDSLFDGAVENIFEDSKLEINWDAAIRTYATFRVLMREGSADDAPIHVQQSPTKRGTKRNRDELENESIEDFISPKVSPP